MSSPEVHISSMVVHAIPEHIADVRKQIENLPGAEVYAESAEGKLVVVLESDGQKQISATIDRINDLNYVLTTALVYHQIEPLENGENNKS